MHKLITVGVTSSEMKKYTGVEEDIPIMQSSGLRGHIVKRHPECVNYIQRIPEILHRFDYIGRSRQDSIEIVKTLDKDVMVALKIDSSGNYYYVATLHFISHPKVMRRVHSGRLHAI